jgi:hypothetical protein
VKGPPRVQESGRIEIDSASETTRASSRRMLWTLVVSAVTACSLALLIAAIVPSDFEKSHRSSLSARADAFRGLVEVSRKLGFRSSRHTRSYAQLPDPEDCVLVILDPLPAFLLELTHKTRFDLQQVKALQSWIERGGRVVATLGGRTILGAFGVAMDASKSPLGTGSSPASSAAHAAAGGTVPDTLRASPQGMLEGAGILEGFRDEWPAPPERADILLAPYLERESSSVVEGDELELIPFKLPGGPVRLQTFVDDLPIGFERILALDGKTLAVQKQMERGSCYLFSSAYPFTNLALSKGSTGHTVVSLLHAATEGGRRLLVFDEYCHGLASQRGLLGWIWRTNLFYPVIALVIVIVVVAWRNALRLRSSTEPRTVPRRAKEEFVVSLADLALRGGRHRAAARSILDAHRARLRGALVAGREAPEGPELPGVDLLYGRVAVDRGFGEEDLRDVSRRAAELFKELQGRGKGTRP